MKLQLTSLFEYGDWVNQRLFAAAAKLTGEQFTRNLLPGIGSIHLTLVHILGAEAIWFARWTGESPKKLLSPDDLPTLEAIQKRWRKLADDRAAYFAGVGEAELAETITWTNTRGQSFSLARWQVMLHCANHSTHHRSEIAAMLTEFGHEPEGTDLLEFYLERAAQAWKPTGRS